MNEIWRNISGFGEYDKFYQVSNLGKVRSLDKYVSNGNGVRFIKGRILKQGYCGVYPSVILSNAQKVKNIPIHRLVAKTFIPNLNNLPCINHKDCNPENNNVENLEWCTYKYNNEYNDRIKKSIKTRIENNNYSISEETRQKMINSHTGLKQSLKTRQKHSETMKIIWRERKLKNK